VSMKWEPTSAVARIADAGMTAMEAQAKLEAVELVDALIFLGAEGVLAGEDDAMTHPLIRGSKEPDELTVLAHACSHVVSLAQGLGIPLEMTVRGEALGL
jgi:hypothetical protein